MIVKRKLVLTGGSGFVGRNILSILQEHFKVVAPSHAEMDLGNVDQVESFLDKERPAFLVHCAIGDPSRGSAKPILSEVLSSFFALSRYPFERIVYIGSGAEYDKSRDIREVTEDDIGRSLPIDEYGLAKYTLNTLARSSENVFNARIFGCYGPSEPERRFIRHAIDCCLRGKPITIRQDCRFSYVFVSDLGRAIVRLLEGKAKRHDYNICGDRPHCLSYLADCVKRQMNVEVPIEILLDGFANEYSCNGGAFAEEFEDFLFTDIETGIKEEIDWMKGVVAR